MEIGESGVSGVSVARRVNKESNPGNENAITHLQSMAGRNVKDIQVRSECAMKMFHVQVLQLVFCKGNSPALLIVFFFFIRVQLF